MLGRLALKLLRLFAIGIIQGTDVQSLAMEAWASNVRDPLTRHLAKAGNKGTRIGNIARDVFKAAWMSGVTDNVAQPYFFFAPGPGGSQSKLTCFFPPSCVTRFCTDPFLHAMFRLDMQI